MSISDISEYLTDQETLPTYDSLYGSSSAGGERDHVGGVDNKPPAYWTITASETSTQGSVPTLGGANHVEEEEPLNMVRYLFMPCFFSFKRDIRLNITEKSG